MHDCDGVSGSRSVGLVVHEEPQSNGESISRSRNAAAGLLYGATLNRSNHFERYVTCLYLFSLSLYVE